MKRCTAIILIIIYSTNSFSQEISRVSKTDSIRLLDSWKIYVKAIETKDAQVLKQMSLDIVECSFCISPDDLGLKDFFVPADTLIKIMLTSIESSELWKGIKENRFRMTSLIYEDYYPRSLPKEPNKKLVFYELTFSFKLKAFAEGFSYTFQFVKSKNSFKLYGISTVP